MRIEDRREIRSLLRRGRFGGAALLFAMVGAGCDAGVEGPKPSPRIATPDLVCGAQRPTTVQLDGSGFSPSTVDGLTDAPLLALPQVTLTRSTEIDGTPAAGEPIVLNPSPTDTAASEVTWTSQNRLAFVVQPALQLPSGQYAVTVANATGGVSTVADALTVVEPPVVRSATPTPICAAQYENSIELAGEGFLIVAGTRPTVKVGEISFEPSAMTGCVQVPTASGGVERCTAMTIAVPAGGLPTGNHAVTVTNPSPADCQSSEPVNLFVAPPPAVLEASPQPVCLEEGERVATISGSDFLTIGGLLPSATLAGVAVIVEAASDCTPIAELQDVSRCSTLTIRIPQDALPAGVASVVVTNPATAQCASTEPVTMVVVPAPQLDAVTPQPACNAQSARTFLLEGADMLFDGDAAPTVTVGAFEASEVRPVTEACSALEGISGVLRCSRIEVSLPTAALAAGTYATTVTNPLPAGCSTASRDLVIVPPPVVTLVAPDPICVAQSDAVVTVSGEGFLAFGENLPVATIANGAQTLAPAVSLVAESCEPLPGFAGAQRCTQLRLALAEASLDAGVTYAVVVSNPEPAGCQSEPATLTVAPPPQIASVAPLTLCTGGGTFTVGGSDLFGVGAKLVDGAGGEILASNLRVNADGSEAAVTFASGLAPETYILNFEGAGGCSDAAGEFPIRVELGPVAYYLDPPAMYGGVSVRATVYLAGVTSAPGSVVVTPAGGGEETALTNVAWDAANPSIIQATIPSGLAGGQYDLFVRGVSGCDAFLAGGLTVVTDATVALLTPAVQPGFGEAGLPVAVNIYAKASADLLPGEQNFVATPRAYLSSALLSEATPLRAVSFDNAGRLTAVVPPLAEGSYDLIVVNPDNSVGFQPDAYRASTTPPPVIDDLAPTQVQNDTPDDIITVLGANLSPLEALVVELDCLDPGAGSVTTYLATVLSTTGTLLQARIPDASQNISNGSVCVVRVKNTIGDTDPANDIWDEFSALTVTNPASKLAPFRNSGTTLVEPRRAASSAIGKATREARFLFAIGGDDGSPTGAKDSVEAAPLGRFGDIGAWRTIRSRLPRATTLASAFATDGFVWLIGGNKEGLPSDELLRAQVLRPLDAPQVTSIDVRFFSAPDADPATRDGLEPGAWSYAVSARFADTDPVNPGGESLPSEVRTIYTPDVPDGVETELGWSPVFGADGSPAVSYRVYRTLLPNEGSGGLRLLAEVAATSFVDLNLPDFADAATEALRDGDLGSWRLMPTRLATPRAAFGFGVATDASCTPYWYLLGGSTAAASESSSYDVALFDELAGEPGPFATFDVAPAQLAARRELSLFVADTSNAPSVASTVAAGVCRSFLYAAYGVAGAGTGTFINNARVAEVGTGGLLGSWSSAVTASNASAGAVSFFAADGAYLVGGRNGSGPTANAVQGAMRTAPQLGNWSDATADLSVPRELPASARLGAFLYIVGGWDGLSPLASAEFNVR